MIKLIRHPSAFKQGTRILMRLHRNKDGSVIKRPTRKIVTTNEAEWNEALDNLLSDMVQSERIYSSVNTRNIDKAINQFKHNQIDAGEQEFTRKAFYLDIKNHFISCLQNPKSKGTNLFLIDCDSREQFKNAVRQPVVISNYMYHYATKNGTHIITKPFNPQLFNEELGGEIKKDDMMLVAY